eukprot:gene20314-31267_t
MSFVAAVATAMLMAQCRNCFGQTYYGMAFNMSDSGVIGDLTNTTGFIDCCATCEIDYKETCIAWQWSPGSTANGTCVIRHTIPTPTGNVSVKTQDGTFCGTSPNFSPPPAKLP